jgi:Concanavalin A-like lectin/glucanases superfamily/Fibronectin type III domain
MKSSRKLSSRFPHLAMASLALLHAAPFALAAPVTWSSKIYPVNGGWGQFLNTGVFDKSGTLVIAENVGGGTTNFDGIEFAAGTTVFSGNFGGFHDGSGALLSRTGTYGGSGPNTVTFTGLTPGKSYRIQALVYDGRGDPGIPGRTVKFDGVNQGQYAFGVQNVTWGNGLLVTGIFQADAETQNFTVEAFSGSSSKGGQLNALLVHEFVAGAPTITSATATAITDTSATISATLAGVAGDVSVYWDVFDSGEGPWANSKNLGAQALGPVSTTLTGLTRDTQYFFRLSGTNTSPDPDAVGWSEAGTSFATALTGLVPTGLQVTAFSKTEIDISWTDSFNTELEFVIERSPNGTDSWEAIGTAPGNSEMFTDKDLVPGTTWHYRVMARNAAGFSEPSASASATTLAPDPGIVVQAWYRMGDGIPDANGLPADSSVNGRNFLGLVNPATAQSNGGGYGGDAYLNLNGVDQAYYGIGYDAPENNVGVEVWVRTSDLAQGNRHVFGTGSNQNGLNIGYDGDPNNGNQAWFGAVANRAGIGAYGIANYTAGQWIHLAVVRDNGVATFYINGVAAGSSTIAPYNATQPHLGVNAGGGPNAFFSGDVAEARIFTFDAGQFKVSDLLYPAPAVSDPYQAWAGGFANLGNAGPGDDSDGGGLSNLVEWLVGGDPTTSADDATLAPTLASSNDPDRVSFSFRRRDAAAADAATAIRVEYGSDLATWRNTADHGAADQVTVDDTTDLGGGFHKVTVSIPRSLAANGKLFARLKAARQ